MRDNISEKVQLLLNKNNTVGCRAMKELQDISESNVEVYEYMDTFGEMLEHENSYVRNRVLTLIAYNAKWDKDYKIDELIDSYLTHITDVKPITARQCIKYLPMISQSKPELKQDILNALKKANISFYPDSMQPLVRKDIQKAIEDISK